MRRFDVYSSRMKDKGQRTERGARAPGEEGRGLGAKSSATLGSICGPSAAGADILEMLVVCANFLTGVV